MSKNRIDLHYELRYLKYEHDFLQGIDCSKEDSKKYRLMKKEGQTLPQGVFEYTINDVPSGDFYTVYETDLTQSEKQEYLILKQSQDIKTIKNCVVFFTVLAILQIIFGLIILLNN